MRFLERVRPHISFMRPVVVRTAVGLGRKWCDCRNFWHVSRQQNHSDMSTPRMKALALLQERTFSNVCERENGDCSISRHLKCKPEILDAMKNHQPVVALESTIVAHGMPFPQNYEVALEVEDILRKEGVVPATIAILEGVPRIGLSKEELYNLAREGSKAVKCSSRDLPYVVGNNSSSSSGSWGATTVASTMTLARLAGIETFVTGGSGGVHRDGHNTLDISADLFELSRTPVVVVSAGIKSILDIARTLEVLETYSVPVFSYMHNSEKEEDAATVYDFPAFFSPHSGIPSPRIVRRPEDVSNMYWVGRDLKMPHGMLVSVPNPEPSECTVVERAIQNALREADSEGVRGRDVTPFILKRVAETTDGASLRSNIALVKNNAKVGARIAAAIATEKRRRALSSKKAISSNLDRLNRNDFDHSLGTTKNQQLAKATTYESMPPVLVVGGAVMDLMASPKKGSRLIPKTSNPGTCVESDGGVGRNIAEVLGKLNLSEQKMEHKDMSSGNYQNPKNHVDLGGVLLYSAVGGQDDFGEGMIHRLEEEYGVMTRLHHSSLSSDEEMMNEAQLSSTSTIRVVPNARTATYLALLDDHRDLFAAIADMDVLHHVTAPAAEVLSHPNVKCLVVDSNPPLSELVLAVSRASASHKMVVWEPTSVPKAVAAACHPGFLENVSIMTPNADEVMAMSECMSTPHEPLEQFFSEANIHGDVEGSGLSRDRALVLASAAQKLLPLMKQVAQNDVKDSAEAAAHIMVTLGKHGVLHCVISSPLTKSVPTSTAPILDVTHYPVPKKIKVENCTGAGDTLTGAFVHGLVVRKLSFPQALRFAMNMALESLVTPHRAIGLDFSFSPTVDHE